MGWFTGFLSGASVMANAVFVYAVEGEAKKRDELEKKYNTLLADFNKSQNENARLNEELLRESRKHVSGFELVDPSNVLHVQLNLDELLSDFDRCLAKVEAEIVDYVNRADDGKWDDSVVHVVFDAYCHDVFLFSSNIVFTFNDSEKATEELHWFMDNFNPDILSTDNQMSIAYCANSSDDYDAVIAERDGYTSNEDGEKNE